MTARQQARVAIPKRFTLPMREIVALQPRFERREGRRALRLLDHPRFRAAYDFMVLRAAAGELDADLRSGGPRFSRFRRKSAWHAWKPSPAQRAPSRGGRAAVVAVVALPPAHP